MYMHNVLFSKWCSIGKLKWTTDTQRWLRHYTVEFLFDGVGCATRLLRTFAWKEHRKKNWQPVTDVLEWWATRRNTYNYTNRNHFFPSPYFLDQLTVNLCMMITLCESQETASLLLNRRKLSNSYLFRSCFRIKNNYLLVILVNLLVKHCIVYPKWV